MIKFFYDLFFMLPLGIALILSAFGMGFGNAAGMSPLIGCIAGSLFIVWLLTVRHCGKKERLLVIGITGVSIVSLFLILGKDKRENIVAEYGWIIAVLAISILAIVIGRIAESFIAAKIAVSVILLAGDVYMMINRSKCPKGTFALGILVIMIYLLELVQRSWIKSGNTDIKNHVARIAPILTAIAIIVLLIPAPAQKFEWKIARSVWKATVTEYKRLVGLITSDKEEYVYAGFSEKGNIQGDISDSGRDVMLISCEKASFDRMYMAGITYEEFDGKVWNSGQNSKTQIRELDYSQTRAAIYKVSPNFDRDFYKVENIEVTSKLFNTKYVFLPTKTNLQSDKTILPGYKETGADVVTDRKIRYGKGYSINCMQLNYGNPELIMAIDTAQPISEEEWDEAQKRNHLSAGERVLYKDYLDYQDEVYKIYGGNREYTMEESLANSNLSDDVKEMVSEAIGNASSDGDYEKLKALSGYLQTMEYNKKPGAIPGNVNSSESYLDYFLLESQSGFCAHYATTFTLLARQLGYPARYVQGYYVEKMTNATEVTVSENSSHAWAEVYFENFGWVPFEATPGYALSGGWDVFGSKPSGMGTRLNTSANQGYSDGNHTEEECEEEKKHINILYIVIPLCCAIFFGIVYFIIINIVSESNYRKMNEKDKVYCMIGKNMRILKILGYSFGDFVTVEEFGTLVSGDKLIAHAVGFLKLYEKVLYSDYTISADDVAKVESDYSLLKSRLKLNKKRYIIYKITTFS